ncbi:MAG TPA: response regulator transcription factor [Gemmatimonadales bacterium]|jgi:DNA-binding NarL/FixJ family response regulator|nr:response regulator transcription factor [Gemmatimonadales bacterium]
MTRLLIADDHPIVREGLRRVVEDAPGGGITVVGEASDGDDLLAQATSVDPDVVLLDITMPGPGFVETIQRLKAIHPRVRILVLSVQPEDQFAVRALKAGAAGYVSKNLSPEHLVTAIQEVVRGGRYVSPSLAQRLAAAVADGADRPPHEGLSAREYQVLCLIGAGKSVKEIAAAMELSVKTVSTYRTRILEKTTLKSNAEIIRYTVEHGLVH